MKYQVYEDGKPCSSRGYKTWEKDTFDTFEEAVEYAKDWAYPYGLDDSVEPDEVMYLSFGTMEIKTL